MHHERDPILLQHFSVCIREYKKPTVRRSRPRIDTYIHTYMHCVHILMSSLWALYFTLLLHCVHVFASMIVSQVGRGGYDQAPKVFLNLIMFWFPGLLR